MFHYQQQIAQLQKYTTQGYANGGYTGDGGKYDVAGIVHKGEYVVNSETTKDLGLNNNNGGIFSEVLQELRDTKRLMITLVADNKNILNIERSLLLTK